ncbi:serine hydroxymethyltransferase [bacterium]|nr:serine hydroxymethyltransferase [bacterium]
MNADALRRTDPEMTALLAEERKRQADTLALIPSENYASRAVEEATGCCLANKYSEGYPGRRYYQGQAVIDKCETLGIQRAKALFAADHANLQPYSGSVGVLATYFAAGCRPGDTIMGLSLAHGGHLSHGHSVNITGRIFNSVQYGVARETERLDYDEIEKLALECKPKVLMAGGSAYPRVFDFPRFRAIADKVGAIFIVDISHIAGLVVGGSHPSPVPHADIVVTTTHKTLRGPRGALIVCKDAFAKAVDRAVFPLLQGGPHQHTQAAIAVALKEAASPKFKEYAHQIVKNAQAMARVLADDGMRIVSGGTDNHLLLVDLQKKNINGKDAAVLLESVGLVCNANMIPYDPGTAAKPSGIRLGTPAITTRGMKEPDCERVGHLIARAINQRDHPAALAAIHEEVRELCRKFPIPEVMV